VTDHYRETEPVDFDAIRTRESGQHRFVYLTVLVPTEWTVGRVHELSERIQADIERELPGGMTFVQVAPRAAPVREAGE
jgi:divalent metal cation (Fe/Co/Zn/Cd) transporter